MRLSSSYKIIPVCKCGSLLQTLTRLAMVQGFAADFLWPGTADWSGWAAVHTALKLLEVIGLDRMRQHNHQLVQDAAEMLMRAFGTKVMLGACCHAIWHSGIRSRVLSCPQPSAQPRARLVCLSRYAQRPRGRAACHQSDSSLCLTRPGITSCSCPAGGAAEHASMAAVQLPSLPDFPPEPATAGRLHHLLRDRCASRPVSRAEG